MGYSQNNRTLLETLCKWAPHWPRPLLNPPGLIAFCEREKAYQTLKDVPGLVMVRQIKMSRQTLTGKPLNSTDSVVLPLPFPFTLRPSEMHAGEGFEKISNPRELDLYLAQHPQAAFYLAPFLNLQNPDGLYRKFRVALIQGTPYVSHLAISEHWVVHYKSAQMELNETKKQEEMRFMQEFEPRIAQPFESIFKEIYRLIPLHYLVLDCGLTHLGELIIFEIDNSAWVHNTDSEELFPYKNTVMQKTLDAFEHMLRQHAHTP
jgi:hypothetical protein